MLVNQGLSESVAQKMSEIFACGLLSPEELDDRAFEALREFNQEGALEVLDQFANSDLSHVQNKSAFLCGVMKTYVTKSSSGGEATSNEASSRADEGKIDQGIAGKNGLHFRYHLRTEEIRWSTARLGRPCTWYWW